MPDKRQWGPHWSRRRFLGTAMTTLAAAELGVVRGIHAQAARAARSAPPGSTSGTPELQSAVGRGAPLEPLKEINAGVLNVGYVEAGPANGAAVMLLHGWPYDIHSFDNVAPLLAQAGFRVIVPYLRGYGTTRFLSAATPRNGQQSVVAVDAIALMDALKRSTRRSSRSSSGSRRLQMGLQRRHVRSHGRVVQQSRSRGHRD